MAPRLYERSTGQRDRQAQLAFERPSTWPILAHTRTLNVSSGESSQAGAKVRARGVTTKVGNSVPRDRGVTVPYRITNCRGSDSSAADRSSTKSSQRSKCITSPSKRISFGTRLAKSTEIRSTSGYERVSLVPLSVTVVGGFRTNWPRYSLLRMIIIRCPPCQTLPSSGRNL